MGLKPFGLLSRRDPDCRDNTKRFPSGTFRIEQERHSISCAAPVLHVPVHLQQQCFPAVRMRRTHIFSFNYSLLKKAAPVQSGAAFFQGYSLGSFQNARPAMGRLSEPIVSIHVSFFEEIVVLRGVRRSEAARARALPPALLRRGRSHRADRGRFISQRIDCHRRSRPYSEAAPH